MSNANTALLCIVWYKDMLVYACAASLAKPHYHTALMRCTAGEVSLICRLPVQSRHPCHAGQQELDPFQTP